MPSGSRAALIARMAATAASPRWRTSQAPLGHADAVLGARRCRRARARARAPRRSAASSSACGPDDVDVQVAVARGGRRRAWSRRAPRARPRRRPRSTKRGQPVDGQGDVGLVDHAERGGRLGVGLAPAPEPLDAGGVVGHRGGGVGQAERCDSPASVGDIGSSPGQLDQERARRHGRERERTPEVGGDDRRARRGASPRRRASAGTAAQRRERRDRVVDRVEPEQQPRAACGGPGTSRRRAAVTMPRVPSLPHRRPGRS